jgi:ankyrin repeat protein
MKQKFGKKFRIITAIEKDDVRLLSHLLITQNHGPEKPVDKLGNNILHVACTLGSLNMVQFIRNTYHLDIFAYNTDGMNSMHLATCNLRLDIIQWLWQQGVDCQSKTIYYEKTPYDIICSMISKNETPDYSNTLTKQMKNKMIDIKNFFRQRYFEDKRGFEIRKFIWIFNKLKSKNEDIGQLPKGMIREIAEYF